MTILLPGLTFVAIFLALNGRERAAEMSREDWRGAFLRAMVAWGMLLILILEGLGFVSGIERIWVSLAWAAALGIVLWPGLRRGLIQHAWRRLFPPCKGWGRAEIALLASLALIMALLLIVAWVAPANNTDSLKYHMARVMHWAQAGNLEHFPTARLAQLVRPHWAEAAILNARILWSDDRPANLVQWFSLLGSVIGAAGIAALFGVNRRGQLLTAAFCMSIPMALLQATSTQNDLIAAFWVVCLGYFVVLQVKGDTGLENAFFVSGALALGMLTKGTFFPFAFPLMAWYFLSLIFRARLVEIMRSGAVIIAVVFAINLPFWSRNVISFGGIYGPPGSTNLNINLERYIPISGPMPAFPTPIPVQPATVSTPTGAGEDPPDIVEAPAAGGEAAAPEIGPEGDALESEQEGGGGLPGRLAIQGRRVALLLGMHTVYPEVGGFLHRTMRQVPGVFSPFFMDRLEQGLWNHEDTAGSLLHLLFILLAILMLPILRRSPGWNLILAYTAVALCGYVMISFISYSVNVFSVRYQLGFFTLMAPVVAAVFSEQRFNRTTTVLAGFFVIASLPYVFVNNSRPLIGMRPARTRVGSILVEPREDIMFAVVPEIKADYFAARDAIRQANCTDVGLHLWDEDLEYLFWWVLDAPQSGVRLEVTQAIPIPVRKPAEAFEPCAVICTQCNGIENLYGLPLAMDLPSLNLYLEKQ